MEMIIKSFGVMFIVIFLAFILAGITAIYEKYNKN